ncbi:hypothetical protein FHS96_005290 [Sphingomonas zeicaulis]|uniref:hypothetical protein n=1 Tax=Sphingomonas zeicaulis TaxID=1632740 RepID=UPI003D1B842F
MKDRSKSGAAGRDVAGGGWSQTTVLVRFVINAEAAGPQQDDRGGRGKWKGRVLESSVQKPVLAMEHTEVLLRPFLPKALSFARHRQQNRSMPRFRQQGRAKREPGRRLQGREAGEFIRNASIVAARAGLCAIALVALAAPAATPADDATLPPADCDAKARIAAAIMRWLAADLRAEAAYVAANGGAVRPLTMQAFADWYRTESARSREDLPALTDTHITPAQKAARDAAFEVFMTRRIEESLAGGRAIEAELDRDCPREKVPE